VIKLTDSETVEADVIQSLELVRPVDEILAAIEIKVADLSIDHAFLLPSLRKVQLVLRTRVDCLRWT